MVGNAARRLHWTSGMKPAEDCRPTLSARPERLPVRRAPVRDEDLLARVDELFQALDTRRR